MAHSGASLWRGSGLRFTGYGHHYPRTYQLNDDREQPDGNAVDAAVIGAVEVRGRHVADEDETPAVLACEAARAAIADADVAADDVDLLVVSNWSDRMYAPEHAPTTATLLGANRALAFDICGACTGWVHGVQTAAALLTATPHWRTAVVVGVDRFSRRVRPGSKGELIVGDAAGATVLTKDDDTRAGLVDSVMFSDGSNRELVDFPLPQGWVKSKPHLVEAAISCHAFVADTLLGRSGVKMADIDWVVPHPGTGPMHKRLRTELEIPQERFVTNWVERGNTGSAAIPIVLSEMASAGRLKPGELVFTPTIGSGWFYGGLLFHV